MLDQATDCHAEVFDNRSVAVVGNSAAILSTNHGGAIEAHDVVLRMNRAVPQNPAAQGTRTDVLAFSVFSYVAHLYRDFHAEHLIWMSPKLRETYDSSVKMSFYDPQRWMRLSENLGARPSTGLMVLDLLDGLRPRAVTLYGFDFKTRRSVHQAVNRIGPHDFDRERRYVEELLWRRGWTLSVLPD